MAEQPYSQHPYQYGYSDPVLMTDPSGRCTDPKQKPDACQKAIEWLKGYGLEVPYPNDWEIEQLWVVEWGVWEMTNGPGLARWTPSAFKKAITADKYRIELHRVNQPNAGGTPPGIAFTSAPNPIQITFYNDALSGSPSRRQASSNVVHELAHAWDAAHGNELSNNMAAATGGSINCSRACRWSLPQMNGFCALFGYTYNYGKGPGRKEVPSWSHGKDNHLEDWATAVQAVVYPDLFPEWTNSPEKNTTRRQFVRDQFDAFSRL